MISVIVPIYNQEKYLANCIDSLLTQTYREIEILLIDDGSSDRSGDIGQGYAARHHNIRYFRQENQGVSVARNLGLAHTQGDWVLFADGDDFADKHLIEELYAGTDNDTDIICCSCQIFDSETQNCRNYDFFPKEFTCRNPEEKNILFYQLMIAQYGQENRPYVTAIGVPWGKLYRKSFLDKYHLTFDPALRRMQDNIFNTQAFYYARKIIYSSKHLYFYRQEHIRSYDVAYDPEIYRRVLKSRDDFFQHDTYFENEDMLHFRNAERIDFLYASLKNILLTAGNFHEALPRMQQLMCTVPYIDLLADGSVKWSKKLNILRFLHAHKLYRLMYFTLKQLWRIKNVYGHK